MKEREAYKSVPSPHISGSTLVFQWLTHFLSLRAAALKRRGEPLHPHGGQNGKTSLNSTSRQNQDKVLDSEDQSHRSALPSSRTDPILCTLKQTFPGLSCHFRTKTIPPAYAFLPALRSPSVTNHQRTAQEPPGREFACWLSRGEFFRLAEG